MKVSKQINKIDIPLERQKELGVIFPPHKEARIWWDIGHGGEFKVHADFIVEEGGSLKEVIKEIMERAKVFMMGGVIIHFDVSIGPISNKETKMFKERIGV